MKTIKRDSFIQRSNLENSTSSFFIFYLFIYCYFNYYYIFIFTIIEYKTTSS